MFFWEAGERPDAHDIRGLVASEFSIVYLTLTIKHSSFFLCRYCYAVFLATQAAIVVNINVCHVFVVRMRT